jgi:hypothetical protein
MDLAGINQKLDAQMQRIEHQLQSNDLSVEERRDLQIMQARLIKTRHLANQADELVQQDSQDARKKIRMIGLFLCAISLVGLAGIAWLWFQL